MHARRPVRLDDIRNLMYFFVRIKLAIAGLLIITSVAALLPLRSAVWSSLCEMTEVKTPASWTRICDCWPCGNTSIIRSIVDAALHV